MSISSAAFFKISWILPNKLYFCNIFSVNVFISSIYRTLFIKQYFPAILFSAYVKSPILSQWKKTILQISLVKKIHSYLICVLVFLAWIPCQSRKKNRKQQITKKVEENAFANKETRETSDRRFWGRVRIIFYIRLVCCVQVLYWNVY